MHGFLYCNIDEGFGVRGVLPFDCLRKRGSRFYRFKRFKRFNRFDGVVRRIKIGKRRGVLEYRVFSYRQLSLRGRCPEGADRAQAV